MAKFSFTDKANNDLEKIIEHTVKNWGKEQAHNYLSGLEAQAAQLADTPDIGSRRDHLHDGLLSFPYQSHVLFYTKQTSGIVIIRILHERMEAAHHLQ